MKIENIEKFRKNLRKFLLMIDKIDKKSLICNSITVPQCHTILALKDNNNCTLQTLTKKLDLDKSTVSRTVDGLVKTKLVNRQINPENRRENILSLSDEGLNIVNSIDNENNTFFNKVFNNVPIIEAQKILSNFDILVKLIDKSIISEKK